VPPLARTGGLDQPEHAVRDQGLVLPFDSQRLHALSPYAVTDHGVRHLPDQHLARGSALLEAGGQVRCGVLGKR
jgi:hypothetical protein